MDNACRITLKVIPNASRNEVIGWMGDMLKIKVSAPPQDGRATAALCDFLADELGVPRRAISVVHGDKSRQKIVSVAGLSLSDVRAKLSV